MKRLPQLIIFTLCAACAQTTAKPNDSAVGAAKIEPVADVCTDDKLTVAALACLADDKTVPDPECMKHAQRAAPQLFSGDMLRFACDELEYASVAVRAYGGQPAPTKWQPLMADKAWYRARTAGKAADAAIGPSCERLSTYLDAATDICRRQIEYTRTADYRQKVIEWLGMRNNNPPVPAKLFVDSQPASEPEFRRFVRHDDGSSPVDAYFSFELSSPIRAAFVDDFWRDKLGSHNILMVSVGTSASGLFCIDATGIDCEGYEGISFFFDVETDDMVAISVGASG